MSWFRRFTEWVATNVLGADELGQPIIMKVLREIKSHLVASGGRAYVPPNVELVLHPDDNRALTHTAGTSDVTAFVRGELESAVEGVAVPDTFRVTVREDSSRPPGRPECRSGRDRLVMMPFLASEAEGMRAPVNRRLPLRSDLQVTRELLATLVGSDVEVSSSRHATIVIVSREEIEIRTVPNRYTAVDGTPIQSRARLRRSRRGYQVTFGSRRLVLFWSEVWHSTLVGASP